MWDPGEAQLNCWNETGLEVLQVTEQHYEPGQQLCKKNLSLEKYKKKHVQYERTVFTWLLPIAAA